MPSKRTTKSIGYYLWPVFMALAFIGAVDSGYLTYEHYQESTPGCAVGSCGEVLESEYAESLGIPLALWGVGFYLTLLFLGTLFLVTKRTLVLVPLLGVAGGGFFSALIFIHIQVNLIGAVCMYCVISAVVSTLLFFLSLALYAERSKSK